jgi:hypothetical protein
MTKALTPSAIVVLLLTLVVPVIAAAEQWELIGSDKDAFGNDMRTVEIDLSSLKTTMEGVSVQERITQAATSNTGYNCSEGEIRHHNTSKQIAELLCSRSSAANPHGAHVPDWRTLDSHTSARGSLTNQVDLNTVARINDEVMVVSRLLTVESVHASYDCKGYYKTQGAWASLDTTDHIPTVPRNFVSLERKAAARLCGTSR